MAKQKKAIKKTPKKPIETADDTWKILRFPHLAEKSMNMVEFQNKLTFIVDNKANKTQVKKAVERGFDVVVEKVNVEITRKGIKKAYVTLSSKHSAADIATRLGMI